MGDVTTGPSFPANDTSSKYDQSDRIWLEMDLEARDQQGSGVRKQIVLRSALRVLSHFPCWGTPTAIYTSDDAAAQLSLPKC